VPDIPGLRVQAVHGDDLARAYVEACAREVHGAFNLAADPVLDAAVLAEALGARRVPLPFPVARACAAASWRLHLQPSEPGWLDLGLGVPLMSCERAARELDWAPARSALDACLELIDGMRAGAGGPTPPLDTTAGGRLRAGELASGVGSREPRL
jgi:nucleoside-diphosphate-sugar epimerase